MSKPARLAAAMLSIFPVVVWSKAFCDIDQGYSNLFQCETGRAGKSIGICARSDNGTGPWDHVQYWFGNPDKPEMVYPSRAEEGAGRLWFSHFYRGREYHVNVRFVSGRYTYRVYSIHIPKSTGEGEDVVDGGAAGVEVSDASGRRVADIKCAERPQLFIPYLQETIGCDERGRYGKAACGGKPVRVDGRQGR